MEQIPWWWNAIVFFIGWICHMVVMWIMEYQATPYQWICPYCLTEKKRTRFKTNSYEATQKMKIDHVTQFHPDKKELYIHDQAN